MTGHLLDHLSGFFGGHRITRRRWDTGPIRTRAPGFCAFEIGPGPRSKLWTYVSSGAMQMHPEGRVEFCLIAEKAGMRLVELLAMTVHYHARTRLGLGHTFPIGEPWLPGSRCDHCLVSLPYPFGPQLEVASVNGEHVHVFWLLPITESERDFKKANGQEALEKLFENQSLRYWDPLRAAVV